MSAVVSFRHIVLTIPQDRGRKIIKLNQETSLKSQVSSLVAISANRMLEIWDWSVISETGLQSQFYDLGSSLLGQF
jgi:hypothetical protein